MVRPGIVLTYLGRITILIGIAMLTCIPWSLFYQESDAAVIALAAIITIASGLFFSFFYGHREEGINYKEGFCVVTLGWVFASLFGSLPYLFTGSLVSVPDAIFETVSGFTTTGATVITDVEALSHGILFWRSLTHWLGGMGIIALFVAIMAGLGARANQLFRAEVPGPVADKVSPRIRENARFLWLTYMILSLGLFVLLACFGMGIFDAMCHTFSTMATGGFSTKNSSIAYYSSPAIQWTIILFMFLSGASFALHYRAYQKRSLRLYGRNSEFVFYSFITLVFAAIIFLSLGSPANLSQFEAHLRSSLFQVVSIITTTGYVTENYDYWPALAQGILFMAMFIGGCAGSTGGNIKPGRYLILFYRAFIELRQMVHPRAVQPVKLSGRALDDALVINVLQFFFLYIFILAVGTICLTVEDLDVFSSLTGTAACLGNIGPGFGALGPTENFALLSAVNKVILSMIMLIGRLEIYPVLLMFIPAFWRE